MIFDIYGRFRLEIRREGEAWVAYRMEPGTRVPDPELIIPADIPAAELAVYLDDLFHELAGPGQEVTQINQGK